ncbi:hypothetical protein [Streptomyces sp. ISL-11]|uniref:hypothetical protein n=1 Tax=Streptomyces sp. ISL-11 TaxID=2819174 RepID=UPI001BE84A7A|nr:hypothetical protein [Streptomyces sp. ISL-11]MBT2382890.1 hypothetical protein [Streptomyces sp. ISL-11]
MSPKLRQIMLAAAEDTTTLRELRDDPQALADRFGLCSGERDRLAQAERLSPRPAGEFLTITIPITLTHTQGIGL